jgi:hypothetical protein
VRVDAAMKGYPISLSCRCRACGLDQVLELLRTGRIEAARLALEEAARAIRREQPGRCTRTGSIPPPRSPAGPEAA